MYPLFCHPLQALAIKTVEELESLLGADNHAVADLRQLFSLAAAYGYADWLVFDASVVRGLAYYTGGCWRVWYVGSAGRWGECAAWLTTQVGGRRWVRLSAGQHEGWVAGWKSGLLL